MLVLCGCSSESSVGLALRSVNLWAGGSDNTVEVFENQNDALEVRSSLCALMRGEELTTYGWQHCENAFLRSLYSKAFDAPHLVSAAGPSLTSQIGARFLPCGVFSDSPHASLQTYRKRNSTATSGSSCSPLAHLIYDTPQRRP